MKFTYEWLKQYIDFPWSPLELAEKLTFAGIEVEEITSIGGGVLERVVVCQILASEKHPNADRLSVCRVTHGAEERQIVCGAKNYKVGDKVPLALPGVTVAGGLTIKLAKLRGVESQGMLCSAAELGLPKGEDGLLILPAEAVVGSKLSEALGGADTVYDIEVTPNRPDWLSVIGIAREVAAMTGGQVQLPAIAISESPASVEQLAAVKVEATDLCPRYTARVIRGVKIGPSPGWLRQRLEKVGMRAINNVVDVTNYVLLESGQPLHAFDYDLVAKHQIIVRRAKPGEAFTAIDDSPHVLTEEMLVIADAERAVALAGVMGGKNSEIHPGTTNVLLESAWFLPANVRQTSKRTGLASESSYRFERGADIGGVVWASDRAAQLIQQVAGGQVAQGIIDALARPVTKRQVTCRYAQVDRLLGVAVPPATVTRIFAGLGLTVASAGTESCTVEVPTFRVDLEREADLIEEICRIHGVEKIPAQMQPATPMVSAGDAAWDRLRELRRILTGLGFHEAQNQTLVAEGELKLQNPLTSEQGALRRALVPGLLANLRTNISRHQFAVRLFEIGRVFAADGSETLRLGLVATGPRDPHAWDTTARAVTTDAYDLKGALEEVAAQLGVALPTDVQAVDLVTTRRLDLRDPVFAAELELGPVLAAAGREKRFVELPNQPAVERDVALVVDEQVPHAAILAAIQQHRTNLLERVELFDIFRGNPIPPGKKSLAYALRYRAADRTLTDAEVNAAHDELKRHLQREVPCEIRE